MLRFIDPAAQLRTSFLAAVAEFRADPDYPVPWFVDDVDPQALVAPAAFETYIARVLGERTPSGGRRGFVPAPPWCTTAATCRSPRTPPASDSAGSGRSSGRRQELVRMTSCWVARVIAT
ncbi:hypothetical protein ABT294_07210 [Nonomuraea sp. NPDC000554]|uniref:hypothetical protein n=1 Tax=Nonomuraea sp. NPDC000554 TaxID=3154259 RepID=UPI003331AEA7